MMCKMVLIDVLNSCAVVAHMFFSCSMRQDINPLHNLNTNNNCDQQVAGDLSMWMP